MHRKMWARTLSSRWWDGPDLEIDGLEGAENPLRGRPSRPPSRTSRRVSTRAASHSKVLSVGWMSACTTVVSTRSFAQDQLCVLIEKHPMFVPSERRGVMHKAVSGTGDDPDQEHVSVSGHQVWHIGHN